MGKGVTGMKDFKVGLQLFSVREDMEKDVESTLARVKEMGYDCVEFAGYFDTPADTLKGYLDKYALECISVHQVYDIFLNDEKASIDFLKTIGAKYCAVPWMGKEKHAGSGVFDQTIKEFIQVGTALQNAGIQLLYHNHDFEFETYEGKFLLDWLYESVSSELLQTEIDTCWVRYAGYSPEDYLRKYSGRSPIVHLKDFVCNNFNMGPVYSLIDTAGKEGKPADKESAGFEFRPVGHGVQDIPSILKAAEDAGAHTVIVEQDQSPDRPPMEAAKMSRDYLKSLGL